MIHDVELVRKERMQTSNHDDTVVIIHSSQLVNGRKLTSEDTVVIRRAALFAFRFVYR